LTAIVVAGLAIAAAAAQQRPRIPPTGEIKPVRDNLYVIPGAGGNTTVFVTETGVVLVDTKLAGNGEAIMTQVRTVTDRPVSTVINTHSHPDHIGSNDFFPASVEVVTHENTRKWMAANAKVAANPVVMPDRTFTERMTLGQGRDRIDLYYFGAGHTDGDAFIVFPFVRAMAAGDMFAWKMAPLIDPNAGGSVVALADTLEKTLRGIPNVDTVIEGHGDVNTWAGFGDYVRFNRALLEAARTGMGRQTAEEVAASLKPAFPVFTKDELLTDMEYGGTPLSRAVINVTVAFKELADRYRLKVTARLPCALFSTPTIEAPSADSSPVNVHGCVLGSSKLMRRPSILNSRSGLSILPFGRFVPTSLPWTVPFAFFVKSSSISRSTVTMRGRPTHRPASAPAMSAETATCVTVSTGGFSRSWRFVVT
jgi:glyoxylase-like metal-dependent hydrolase (beta-lactamase superfamily II)